MRPERCWSVILMLGLFMALSPLSAQAGPNRSLAPQPNRQAFTRPQPRAHAPQMNRQAFNPAQSRGHVSNWNRQPQHFGHANTWNRQPHHYQQPRGHAYGWNGQNRQWHQPRGQAYGWNGHNRQGHQPYGNAYGWNGHQRNQWNQHRNASGQNDHQWQRPPNGGQHNNPGSSYNRAGHPTQPHSPNIAPNPSGYSHNAPLPAGQTGERPGFRHPEASGNTPAHNQSPSGVI